MSTVRAARCGTWASPVTAQIVAAGAVRLGGITVDGGDVYWIEGRPEQGGRSVIVRRSVDGRIADVTSGDTNVRTRVHEYGGGAYAVRHQSLYFVEFSDQRLYSLQGGGTPEPLTPPGHWCYADLSVDPVRPRLVCVREDHSEAGKPPVTTLVSVRLDGRQTPGEVLASGYDFYSTPRFSPDGTRISWLSWRHPLMPWDGSELWIADVSHDGSLERPRHVAGGEGESIFQPGWSPDGTLYLVSDRSGWWNLYRLRQTIEPVCPMDADFGRPSWQFGTSTWAAVDDGHLAVTYTQKGRWHLALLAVSTGALDHVGADLEPADSIAATRSEIFLLAGSAAESDRVVRIDLATRAVEPLRAASSIVIDRAFVARPEAIEFPTDGNQTAHAFFYRPLNPLCVPLPGERPPLIVISHGGPTAMANARLNLETQYWTSRGFAIVDVNYGGSTGFGRAYRERLRGQWGVVDVTDCIRAVENLIALGYADADRLIVRGRSAGGFTALAALTQRPEVFKAGASYYGVADLERLARDTHKFESRYLDGLIAPYPAGADLYRARSPLRLANRLSCPVIFFQGLEDRVVPPDQSELMAEALRSKGLPVALLTFRGEQHGFRRADTIARCLEAELLFYGVVFGFTPAERLPPVVIDNLNR
jgi:dipeptidyl aminopeptidase/acylaminoacyl peptidase